MLTAGSSWEVRPVHALWQPCLWLCSKALVDAWEGFMVVSALRESMGAWYSMQQRDPITDPTTVCQVRA